MLRNKVWRLYSVPIRDAYVQSDNMFRFFPGPDMCDYALFCKLSTYTCTIFVSSVSIRKTICVWHVIILVGSIFIPVMFCTQCTAISVGLVIMSGVTVSASLCPRILY